MEDVIERIKYKDVACIITNCLIFDCTVDEIKTREDIPTIGAFEFEPAINIKNCKVINSV